MGGCRDIDPGELAKVPKERTFFNVAKTNGSRYRSTHVYDLAGTGGNVRLVVQAQKAHFAETGLAPRFLRDVSGLPLDVWHFDCRGLFSRREVRDAHYRNCFTRHLRSTYICYGCGRHYRNCRRTICLKFGSRVFARSASIKQ